MTLRLLALSALVAGSYAGWLVWKRPPSRLARLDLSGLGVGGPAIVQFTSETCGPCKATAPRLAEAANRGGVRFAQVDVGERPEVAYRYGIRTLPTIVVAGSAGEVVGAWTALPADGPLDEAIRRAAL